jgi:putative peptidoglycan lipid II flippase
LTRSELTPHKPEGGLPQGTLVVSAVTALTVVLAFAREATLAYCFGASEQLDAALVGITIPQFMAKLALLVSTGVVLPLYIDRRRSQGDQAGRDLLRGWFRLLLLSGLVGCGAVFLLAEPIIFLLAPGLSEAAAELGGNVLRLALPFSLFLGLTCCFKIALESRRRFLLTTSAMATVSSAIVITCLLAAGSLGVYAIATGLLVGAGVAFAVQWVGCRAVEPGLVTLRKPAGVKLPIRPALAMLTVPMAYQAQLLLDRGFASSLVEGSIVALALATALTHVFTTVVTGAVAKALFPSLAEKVSAGDHAGASRQARTWAVVASLAGVIPCALMVVFRHELVVLVFQRGQFDEAASQQTASVLAFLPLMMIVAGGSNIYLRLLLAQKQARALGILAVSLLPVKVLLNFLLIAPMGLAGLALATVLVQALELLGRLLLASKVARG